MESKIELNAEYNVPSAVPQSKSVDGVFFPAMAITSAPEISAPKKEPNCKDEKKVVLKIPAQEAKTAPNVAPEETPIIPGSASGFLKNNWNTEPLPAKVMPAIRQRIVRGSLMLKKTIFEKLSPLQNTSVTFICSAPKIKEKNMLAANIINSEAFFI